MTVVRTGNLSMCQLTRVVRTGNVSLHWEPYNMSALTVVCMAILECVSSLSLWYALELL